MNYIKNLISTQKLLQVYTFDFDDKYFHGFNVDEIFICIRSSDNKL